MECYFCEHYYAKTFDGDRSSVRIDACRLASKTKLRHPGAGVAERCVDYTKNELIEQLQLRGGKHE